MLQVFPVLDMRDSALQSLNFIGISSQLHNAEFWIGILWASLTQSWASIWRGIENDGV